VTNEYVTIEEASNLTGLSKGTLYAYIHAGRIEGAKRLKSLYGRVWKIPVKWIDDFNSGQVDTSGAYEGYQKKRNHE
jgi:excisionase family DNA binding protein